MKTQFTLKLLLTLFILSSVSCQQLTNLTKPKPIIIDGLGYLSELTSEPLSGDELLKVVKTVTKQSRVTDEDAQHLLVIFQQNINQFISASGRFDKSNETPDVIDVERYLERILLHEKLRTETERIVQSAIVERVAQEIRFDEAGAGVTTAGDFGGAYVNAFNNAVSRNDEKLRDAAYNRQQTTNNLATLSAFERVAQRTINDPQASAQAKQGATEFLKDLQTYNAALPNTEKIINSDGNLVNIGETTARQRKHLVNIVTNNFEDSIKRTPELTAATNRLSKQMSATFSAITLRTNTQIRR